MYFGHPSRWSRPRPSPPPKKIKNGQDEVVFLTGSKKKHFFYLNESTCKRHTRVGRHLTASPGSAVEGFPVALDLQGTIHQEVKSPAISVNLSGALPTITGGATSIPTSVAERVRPTVTVEEHVPSCSQRCLELTAF